ncbi:MAG: DUF3750 domain-containing protein [Alphaproteobacteria bacterium]|nr:DUF3750 domain-containing protein [Alphaproteobacteria bacterium]
MTLWQWILALTALLFAAGPLASLASSEVDLQADWRTADRTSTGLAPDPATTPEAVLQVYAARAFSWRGILGVHSWIAIKPANATEFTVYQIIGWHRFYGRPTLSVEEGPPDRRWYGHTPAILLDIRGERAEALIGKTEAAIRAYPYATYRLWPGPNSNTFTAYVGRRVPEMGLALPPTAIGKDFLTNHAVFGPAPSGTGRQFSLFGLFGALYGKKEGFELNFMGLVIGFDPLNPAILLPGVGRIGLSGANGAKTSPAGG